MTTKQSNLVTEKQKAPAAFGAAIWLGGNVTDTTPACSPNNKPCDLWSGDYITTESDWQRAMMMAKETARCLKEARNCARLGFSRLRSHLRKSSTRTIQKIVGLPYRIADLIR